MNWTVTINNKTDIRDASNNLIRRVVSFTVDNGAGTYDISIVSIDGDDLLLTALDQRALVKQKIRNKIASLIANAAITQASDSALNQVYTETT